MKVAAFLAIILLAGCAKHDDNCTSASEYYTFQTNKSLDTSANRVSIVNGNETVFNFRYNYEQCLGVVGGALSRDIYFEIPINTGNEFSYTGEALSNANALAYLVAPIYPALRLRPLVQGTIRGTRLSSAKWHIEASLNTGTEIIDIDKDFLRTD